VVDHHLAGVRLLSLDQEQVLVRIITHMVIGPDEADRYLDQVIDRVMGWTDEFHAVIDAGATTMREFQIVDQYTANVEESKLRWEDHEGKFREDAWRRMEAMMAPTADDYIVLLDADEVILDPWVLRPAIMANHGRRLSYTFHEMWSQNQFRVDGHWKPYQAWIVVPYRPGGHFVDRALASGREPTYVAKIPRIDEPVGNLLHYGYARAEDRQFKYDRYQRLDGGRFHNPNHLRSILHTPVLEAWQGGGLINVERTE
jgi:hypothetical protein